MCSQGEFYGQQRCCSLRLLSGVIVYRKSTHKPNLITTPVDSPTTLDPAKPQTKATKVQISSKCSRIIFAPWSLYLPLLRFTKMNNCIDTPACAPGRSFGDCTPNQKPHSPKANSALLNALRLGTKRRSILPLRKLRFRLYLRETFYCLSVKLPLWTL